MKHLIELGMLVAHLVLNAQTERNTKPEHQDVFIDCTTSACHLDTQSLKVPEVFETIVFIEDNFNYVSHQTFFISIENNVCLRLNRKQTIQF
ncbi:hypothetical protein [Formosa sp. S-31]|uniref:hypothetical protein n=1 Tax=Formosa sp. S-31 TaxID=2790949 RepID=UPI003EBDF03E